MGGDEKALSRHARARTVATTDTHLPSSCKHCANVARKPTKMCFFCRGMVCEDHSRMVRKIVGHRRLVRCCSECTMTAFRQYMGGEHD